MRQTSSALFWILLLLVLAAAGVFYSVVIYDRGHPLIGAGFSLGTCLPILAFERGHIFRRLYRRIHALPTPAFIVSALLAYYLLMTAGFAFAGTLLWLADMTRRPLMVMAFMPFEVMIYSFAVCAAIVFVMRVRELLGRDVFVSLFIARYRTPVREERVFLFIDLVDSTGFAEEYGDLQAQKLLSSLFSVIAEPVRRNKGTIDDYVGDAAIITWPLARGIEDARCVLCIFDILEAIELRAKDWTRKYGRVPKLRAAIHGGEVITAEIGVDHHKITYFGDTVNTTARLETLCRTLNAPVLMSTDLAERVVLPANIRAEYLGTHAVKGRGHELGVVALTKVSDGRARPPWQLALDFSTPL